jgi:transposase-like protein
MPRPRTSSYQTRRRWRSIDAAAALSALHDSGLSVAAFAAQEGLEAQRLYRWRRQLGAMVHATQPTPAFVEIQPRQAEPVEVILRSGRVLRVSESICPAALERLVVALERAPAC